MNLRRKCAAEALGTGFLVFVAGSTLTFSDQTSLSIGLALSLGFTLTALGYGLGHISGNHFNPVVTLGFHVAGRLPRRTALLYAAAQMLGAALAAGALALIASGQAGQGAAFSVFSSGYGDHSPGGFGLLSVLTTDLLMGLLLSLIALGANDGRAPQRLAPLAIGLGFSAIQLAGFPILGLTAHPALSTAGALIGGAPAGLQLWAFWLAPLIGGYLGGQVYRRLSKMH